MFLLLAVLIGLLTAPLVRGRLGRLADTTLRLPLAPVAALLLQAAIAGAASAPSALLRFGHVASYAVAAVFVVANRDRFGVLLLGLGGALNGLAITVNGGVMPASAGAVARAGIVHEAGRFHNSAVVEGARLGFLGDVFALPAGLPISNVFSVGDLLLLVGGVVLVHELAGSTWTSRLSRRGYPGVGSRSGDRGGASAPLRKVRTPQGRTLGNAQAR